jgi:hypothetical protein
MSYFFGGQVLSAPQMRAVLSEAQNHRCCYCGVKMIDMRGDRLCATIDHVIPKSLGGSDDWENLVAACDLCNVTRGITDAFYFFHARDELSRLHDAFMIQRVNRSMTAYDRAGNIIARFMGSQVPRRLSAIAAPISGATFATIWPKETPA